MRIFRTTAIVAASAIALALIAIAPARAADPVGTWLTGDKKGKVKIVNCGGAICGTLTWLAEPNDPETKQPKTDKNNKDTSKQSRPLLGVPIVLEYETGRRRQVGRPSLQRRGRRHLYRVVHDEQRQFRRAQGLRHGRLAVQGPDLDAVELMAS